VADDTSAFLRAASTLRSGVLYIPPGRYVIRQAIVFKRPVTLQGAGPGSSVLFFPDSLQTLSELRAPNSTRSTTIARSRVSVALSKPAGLSNSSATALWVASKDDMQGVPVWGPNRGFSPWSFGPGLISFTGDDGVSGSPLLAALLQDARRGQSRIKVNTTQRIRVGQVVVLHMGNTGSCRDSLLIDLNNGVRDQYCRDDSCREDHMYWFHSRVAEIPDAQTLVLERPLPYNMTVRCNAQVHTDAITLRDFGIEHLTLEMPPTPYPGHWRERGYNGLSLRMARDFWVRDVELLNVDVGLSLTWCSGGTVSDVVVSAAPIRRPIAGHHAISLTRSTDMLVTRFDIRAVWEHDLTVDWFAALNVFSSGRGVDLSMDTHRSQTYANLFTDVDAGRGTRAFWCGGGDGRGYTSTAFTTYWNIRASQPIKAPPKEGAFFFGVYINLIGLAASTEGFPTSLVSPTYWYEPLVPAWITPRNLHKAMTATRVSRLKLSPKSPGAAIAATSAQATPPSPPSAWYKPRPPPAPPRSPPVKKRPAN